MIFETDLIGVSGMIELLFYFPIVIKAVPMFMVFTGNVGGELDNGFIVYIS